GKLLDNQDYLAKAERVLVSMRDAMVAQPRAHLDLLSAADFYLRPTREIAVAGKPDSDETRTLLDIVHSRFIPNKILAAVEPGGSGAEAVQEKIPLLRGKTMVSGKTTVYVCENFACKRPVSDAAALEGLLESLR
ncbi:MAG: thioredoxin domain-containing protein, partial [Planctomycetota bacterium]